MDRAFRAVFADLEAGRLDHFVLDGQAILLEDYLAGRPGERDRIRDLVLAGRLAVGPWYILPDEFLVSGESTVRNLILGHRAARDLGGVQKVGYMYRIPSGTVAHSCPTTAASGRDSTASSIPAATVTRSTSWAGST